MLRVDVKLFAGQQLNEDVLRDVDELLFVGDVDEVVADERERGGLEEEAVVVGREPVDPDRVGRVHLNGEARDK